MNIQEKIEFLKEMYRWVGIDWEPQYQTDTIEDRHFWFYFGRHFIDAVKKLGEKEGFKKGEEFREEMCHEKYAQMRYEHAGMIKELAKYEWD